MTEIAPLLETIAQGGPFAMAAVFAFLWWGERQERIANNKTVIDTLQSVLPAIDVLDRAARVLEARK